MNAPPDHNESAGSGLTQRVLYMLVFAVAFWILCWVLALTAVTQLLLRLVNGRTQADLARFGAGLAAWTRQVIEFLTFASEEAPFPFSDWPHTGPRVSHENSQAGRS